MCVAFRYYQSLGDMKVLIKDIPSLAMACNNNYEHAWLGEIATASFSVKSKSKLIMKTITA